MDSYSVKHRVQAFGLLGLIPFVALGALFPLWPDDYQDQILQSFALYGAIILAFMAGALWLPSVMEDRKSQKQGMAVAILLSLIAFLAMLLPTPIALGVTAAGFLLLLVTETLQHWILLYPGWYWSLRILLTTAVMFCHLLLGIWLWV